MTQFVDPHLLGGAPVVNRSGALPGTPVHIGRPITPITNAAQLNTITFPFPSQNTKGAAPETYPYIVITNSTPYTLTVSQNAILTNIAAYTQDVVQVPVPDGTAPLTAFVNTATAAVAAGVENSVYATWYPNDPGGQYPAAIGSGTIPIGTNSLVGVSDMGGGFFGTLETAPLPSWVQAIAVKPSISGAGAYVIATFTAGFGIIAEFTIGDGEIFYCPAEGQDVTFTVSSLGGATLGLWFAYGLVGPIASPFIQSSGVGASLAPCGSFAFSVNVVGGATTNLIPAPGFGYQIRLRSWSIHFAVAPVAGTTVVLKTTTGGAILVRYDLAGAINQPNGPPLSSDFWIPNQVAGGIVTPDGLDGQNTTAQACVFSGVYEIWPTPMSPSMTAL